MTKRLGALEHLAAALFAATVVANAASYAFHVVMSRHLGPGGYGVVSAVLNVAVVVSVPATGFQYAVARRVAAAPPEERSTIGAGSLRLGVRLGIAGALAAAMSAPLTARFLHTDALTIIFLAAWFVPLATAPALLGYLQGSRRFRFLVAAVAAVGLSRLAGALAVVATGGGVQAAVAAMTLSAMVPLLVMAAGATDLARAAAIPAGLGREAMTATVPFVAIVVLTSSDTVFARHYLTADGAGHYAAAAVAGKIVLWAPVAIAMAAFPDFATGARSTAVLRRAVGLVAGISAAAVVLVVSAKDVLIGTVFGRDYLPAADVVAVVCLAMGTFAVIQVVAVWSVARQLPALGGLLALVAVAVVALFVASHGSVRAIALDVAAGAFLALAVTVGWLAVQRPRVVAELAA